MNAGIGAHSMRTQELYALVRELFVGTFGRACRHWGRRFEARWDLL